MSMAIIIPARLESTRLSNKLLLRDTGMALICHTVGAAAGVAGPGRGFAGVIVAADSRMIVDEVERFARAGGLNVGAVMTKSSHQSGSDRIAEAAAALPPEVDAILNLQGDEPEIDAAAIAGLVETFEETRPDIATLVYPLTDPRDRANPDLVKVVLGRGGRALYFSRSDIPFRRAGGVYAPPSYGHVGVYLYRRSSLERFVALPQGALEQTEKLEQLRALENGMTITARILGRRPPKGIDTADDYASFVERRKKRSF